jgi:hypothetical protein
MSTAKPLSFQCRHILPEGRRCQAPCLRTQELCYHHHTTRKPLANPRRRRARRATFDFPVLEDHTAIRLALGEILARIAANALDPRRAGLLLYGLQIAALTLPKLAPAKESEPSPHVEDIVLDPILGPLAPRAHIPSQDLDKTGRGRTLAEILMEDWHAGHPTNLPPDPNQEPTPEPQPEPAPNPESTVLPDLKAVAEPHQTPTKARHSERRHAQPHRAGRSRRTPKNPTPPRQPEPSNPKFAPPNPLFHCSGAAAKASFASLSTDAAHRGQIQGVEGKPLPCQYF